MGFLDSVIDTLLPNSHRSINQENPDNWATLFNIFQGIRQDNTPTNQTAHLYNDIYSCVNVLSDDVAKLPIKVYRNKDNKIEKVSEHQIQYLLGKRPNEYMAPFVFKKLMMVDLCLNGNFYALKQYNGKGEITALYPLTGTNTKVMINQNTGYFFYQTMFRNKLINLEPYEVIHIKGFSRNGIEGISPIQVIADQVKADKLAIQMNQKVLENGGTPQGILKINTQIGTKAKENVRESWNQVNSKGAIAIIDGGLDYQQIGVSQADLQFLEGQKFNQQQIAAVYKVPLHKLNQLDHATYSNIEHQSIEYVKNALQPWIVQIEEEFNYHLFNRGIEDDKGCYVKFNLDSELRGDAKSRAEVHKIQIESGAKTPNEVRLLNEDSPYEFGYADKPFLTLNWAPMDIIERLAMSRVNENGMGVLNEKGGEIDEPRETNN